MKSSNSIIRDQASDLLACSTVPQPAVLPHTPLFYVLSLFVFKIFLETSGLVLREGYGTDNQIPCSYMHVNFLVNPLRMQERKERVSPRKDWH